MSGVHAHADIQTQLDTLTARVAVLESAAREPIPALPFGFAAGFALPPDLPAAVIRTPESLRDAVRDGNIIVEIPEATVFAYLFTPRVGPNVRIWSPGQGALLRAHGSHACFDLQGDNIQLDNLELEGGTHDTWGQVLRVGPVDNWWLHHVTSRGAEGGGIECWAWPDTRDAAGDGLLSYCYIGNAGGYNNTMGMLMGAIEGDGISAARTRVTAYRTVWDVYQRGPLLGDGAYVHALECAWKSWGIFGLKTRSGGMALVEGSTFRYAGGGHPGKTISGWGTGAMADYAVRAVDVTLEGGARATEVRPDLVPDPPYAYPRAAVDFEAIVAQAGAGR
jgi:hypothetical protein